MYLRSTAWMQEKSSDFTGQAGNFINRSPNPVSLWWDCPSVPVYSSEVEPWGAAGTACNAPRHFYTPKTTRQGALSLLRRETTTFARFIFWLVIGEVDQ